MPSPLEQAIANAEEEMAKRADAPIQEVQTLLANAGVNPAKVQEIVLNPSLVELIRNNPDLVGQFAQQFPATHAIDYYESRQQMGFDVPGTPPVRPPGFYSESQVTDTGAIEYPGGVIVDQATGVVKFPPNNPSLAGSPAWFAGVPKWSDEKVQKWRQTLHKAGYLDSAKGGRDVQFMEALTQYQTYRYLYGGGDPIDLTSEDARVTREDFGAMLDPAVLKSEVRTWFQEIYDEDPEEDEAGFFAQKIAKVAQRVAKNKGYDPTDATAVARARVMNQFQTSPEAQEVQDLEDERDANTELRDGLLSMAQIVGL